MAFVAVIFILFPEPFFQLFSSDKEVLAIGVIYLTIVSFSYPFKGILMSVSSGFQGAGNTFLAMVLTGIYWIMIVLFSFFLKESYGLNGIWYALIIAAVIAAGLTSVIYKTNLWIPKGLKQS